MAADAVLPNPGSMLPGLTVTFVGRNPAHIEKMRIAMLGAQSPLAVRPKVCTTLTRNLTTRARHRVPDLQCGTHAHCVLVRNVQVVYDWLKALKAVNPLYRDIVIDESEPTIRALNQVKCECAHTRTHARTAATCTHNHSNTYSPARAQQVTSDSARVADSEHVCDVEERAAERADDIARVRTSETPRELCC